LARSAVGPFQSTGLSLLPPPTGPRAHHLGPAQQRPKPQRALPLRLGMLTAGPHVLHRWHVGPGATVASPTSRRIGRRCPHQSPPNQSHAPDSDYLVIRRGFTAYQCYKAHSTSLCSSPSPSQRHRRARSRRKP
jgi:hypothetical protein